MEKKLPALSICALAVALLANSVLPATSATNQSKQIQSLEKKVKALEASVRVLQNSFQSLETSDSQSPKSIGELKEGQFRKLSFVAFMGRDLKCPIGSTPAEKLDGRDVEKGFPDGFSFKNIRAFGLLSGAQINLGVCEINVFSK